MSHLTSAVAVTAHFYTYDPYYAPTLRRYADGGFFAPAWIYGVAAAAGACGLVAARRPAVGAPAVGLAVLLCFVTFLFTGTGH